MRALKSLGARRIRSLFDISPPIEIRPITILLGRNSIGKSTFARLFPLLRQSVERRKRSPILWFGDLVDYGSISQAVTRGEKDLELIFEIQLEDKLRHDNFRPTFASLANYSSKRLANDIKVKEAKVELTISTDNEQDLAYASKISISFANIKTSISIGQDKRVTSISINDKNLNLGDSIIFATQGQILPNLLFARKDPENPDGLIATRNPWLKGISELVKHKVHGNTKPETIQSIASRLPVTSNGLLARAIQTIPGPAMWQDGNKNLSPDQSYVKELAVRLLAGNIESLIEHIDDGLAETFSGVKYLKPLRATAERYYRRVDLAVSEIDPEGRNIPVFLDSLSYSQLASFRRWTKQHLGIDVEPRREGAQLTVMIKGEQDPDFSNIADMGFGISQVLPIAAQLWSASENQERGKPTSFIVIEQPELHLHPEYQARLADVFAGFASKNRPSSQERPKNTQPTPSLIVETHSQHLVNRLGQLVEEKAISKSDVTIILFEPDQSMPGTTTFRTSGFDDQGVLTNWPFGFFDPEF